MGALEPIIHSGNMTSFFSCRTSIILLFRVLRLVRSWKLVGLHIDSLFVLDMLCSYYEVLLSDAQQSTQVSHLERLKDNQHFSFKGTDLFYAKSTNSTNNTIIGDAESNVQGGRRDIWEDQTTLLLFQGELKKHLLQDQGESCQDDSVS